ncbi:hypothetical protein IQ06DRAFT_346715 [Phaeosphaeriaceae sp. SRC1lsM3a]|nr:hypothetical protein IQ06DRAFT_346715 [Stagonospora sp. SRC1lsM3a]
MPSLNTLSVTIFVFLTAVDAASMTLSEGALTGGVGCIPTCNVRVTDSLGSGDNTVDWSGSCVQRTENPSGTQDVDDDHQMTWLRQEDGQVVIDVYRKSDKKYDRWAITNCEGSTPLPGNQCGVAGGGCDANQILFGAQG